MDAELRAEVGHGPALKGARVHQTPGGQGIQILVHLPQGPVRARGDVHLRGPLLQEGRIHLLDDPHGIAVGPVVEIQVDVPEDGADLGTPGPPEVLGELLEFLLQRFHARLLDDYPV